MKQIEQPAACALAAPVAWPCEIEEADFERGVVRLKMRCADYKVGAGLHWLHTAPPRAIPPGYKLVPIKQLVQLKASIHGEYFRGTDWELETISTMLHTAPEAPQPAIPPGWATAYAAFKGAFDTPLARRRDSGEYAQDARRLLREFNDAMFAAPEAPQPVKRQPLTDEEICAALDIDGADDWTFKVAYAAIAAYERKNGIGGQPSMGAIEKSESEDPSPRPS